MVPFRGRPSAAAVDRRLGQARTARAGPGRPRLDPAGGLHRLQRGGDRGSVAAGAASALLGLVVVCAVLLALVLTPTTWSARRLGFDKDDEITIVFCGSKKSLASGIPMAKILFAARRGGRDRAAADAVPPDPVDGVRGAGAALCAAAGGGGCRSGGRTWKDRLSRTSRTVSTVILEREDPMRRARRSGHRVVALRGPPTAPPRALLRRARQRGTGGEFGRDRGTDALAQTQFHRHVRERGRCGHRAMRGVAKPGRARPVPHRSGRRGVAVAASFWARLCRAREWYREIRIRGARAYLNAGARTTHARPPEHTLPCHSGARTSLKLTPTTYLVARVRNASIG